MVKRNARAVDLAVQQVAYERGQRKTAPQIPQRWTRGQRGAYKSWLKKVRSQYFPKTAEPRKRWAEKFEKAKITQELRPYIRMGRSYYSKAQGADIKDLIGDVLQFTYKEIQKYDIEKHRSYFGKRVTTRQFRRYLNSLHRIWQKHKVGDKVSSWNRDLSRFKIIPTKVWYGR